MKKINSVPTVSILVGALSLILIGQHLFTYGMFIDGIVYSTLARNFIFEDFGGFWDFGMHKINPFFSHPPLAFWLQAILFKCLGDFFWIDRLYSIICLVVSLYLIKKLWQSLVPSFPQGAYWVQLIYLILPLVHWSFNNNMLENTSNCFTLLSIWGYVLFYQRQKYRYIIIASLAVFAATLTKGPVGLFPFAFPPLYYLLNRQIAFKKIIAETFIPIFVVGTLWATLLLGSKEAKAYFDSYLYIQLFRSFKGDYGNANHFLVVEKLFSQLLILVGIGIGIRLLTKTKPQNKEYKSSGWLFFLIGLSSSLPITVSPKQMNFYILPSLVFFVFSFAFFHIKHLKQANQFIERQKYIRIIGLLIIVVFIGITTYSYGKISRDQKILNDVFLLGEIVPKRTTIKGTESMTQDWGFYNYLARYYQIDIHFSPGKGPYKITQKDDKIPDWYTLIPSKLNAYHIYKRKPEKKKKKQNL